MFGGVVRRCECASIWCGSRLEGESARSRWSNSVRKREGSTVMVIDAGKGSIRGGERKRVTPTLEGRRRVRAITVNGALID